MSVSTTLTIDGTELVTTENANLDVLAARIRERDEQLLTSARTSWLANGIDLIAAKRLVGHGNFEAWCKSELNYSKSSAEKLMQAALVFGPMLESRTVMDLPPRTVAYALSAGSLPSSIRDEFVPRVLAGEHVAPQVRKAIREWRAGKREEQAATLEAEAHDEHEGRCDGQEDLQLRAQSIQAECDRQAAARTALTLIASLVGDRLQELLSLAADAGPGGVFGFTAERELCNYVNKLGDHQCAPTPDDGVDDGPNVASNAPEDPESEGPHPAAVPDVPVETGFAPSCEPRELKGPADQLGSAMLSEVPSEPEHRVFRYRGGPPSLAERVQRGHRAKSGSGSASGPCPANRDVSALNLKLTGEKDPS